MRIVFYSTNSNKYEKDKMSFKMNPSCETQWEKLKKDFPEHEFFVVAQRPAFFLLDDDSSSFGNLEIGIDKTGIDDIVQKILSFKPDIAIAVTYWTSPFDWMSIKDSLVAEKLRAFGVNAACHPAQTSNICFDKWKTHQFLEKNGFNCSKAVYVQHEMFWAERNHPLVCENVYREFVFSEIEKLKFPVVIKDVYGLSSYGMDVVKSFDAAKSLLLSKKNNSDRLVEEFIEGNSFGLEIYGSSVSTKTNYIVTLPLINSVNQFGLTSPKQNVKLGPVNCFAADEVCGADKNFHIEELMSEMERLARLLKFNGIAQVDLIFDGKKWYVIEINSRLSGMSQTMAYSMNFSLYELILFSAGIFSSKTSKFLTSYKTNKTKSLFHPVMNLKFPLLSDEKISSLMEHEWVFAVNKIENHGAKQLREMGYTEVIFGSSVASSYQVASDYQNDLDETMKMLEILKNEFPDDMVDVFYENAKKLACLIGS